MWQQTFINEEVNVQSMANPTKMCSSAMPNDLFFSMCMRIALASSKASLNRTHIFSTPKTYSTDLNVLANPSMRQ